MICIGLSISSVRPMYLTLKIVEYVDFNRRFQVWRAPRHGKLVVCDDAANCPAALWLKLVMRESARFGRRVQDSVSCLSEFVR